MEENFTTEINKEFYKMQLEAIAQNIIDRANDILEDWDKGIREINLKANISSGCVPTLVVEKEYIVREVK